MADRPSRRQLLRSGIALGTVSVAGCLSLGSGGDSDGGDADGNGTTSDAGSSTDGAGGSGDAGDETSSDDDTDGDPGGDPDPTIDRWPQYQYDAGNTGYVDAEGPTEDVSEAWSESVDPQITASPLLAEDTLYVTDYSGTVHALATEDGSDRWTEDLGETADRTGAIYEDLLIVPTHEAIYGLDLETGDEQWRTANEGKATHLTLVDETVAFGNRNATVRVLNAASGEEEWLSTAPENPIEDALASGGGMLYAHDRYDYVYKFDFSSGIGRQIHSIEGGFETTPTIRDGTFVVGGSDGAAHVYDVEPQELSERWDHTVDNIFTSDCCITDEHVIFTEDDTTTVLSTHSGEHQWQNETEIFAPSQTIIGRDKIYTKNASGMVEGRETSTGALLWNPERYLGEPGGPWEPGEPSAVINNGAIYTCGKSGEIRAFVELSD